MNTWLILFGRVVEHLGAYKNFLAGLGVDVIIIDGQKYLEAVSKPHLRPNGSVAALFKMLTYI
jgi:hypothetical protein